MKKTLLLLLITLSYFQTQAQCWKTIASGYNHTVGIKTDGSLWSFGNNTNGQLGNGTTADKNVPSKVGTSNDWKTMTAGWGHTIALKTDGTLWAWGNGNLGQIGNGSNTVKPYNPQQQIGTEKDWQDIAAGAHYTVALKTDGTLWAWGYNEFGQLGDGTTVNKSSPIQIGIANDWQTIATNNNHTVALKKDGSLWAWGSNNYGQLGDATIIQKNAPTQIGTATNWKTIAAGYEHTTAIKTDGTLWVWGSNNNGQLGDGSTTYKTVPTQMGILTSWKTVACGWGNTIAIKTDETLWAWGYNRLGKLGNGTKVDSHIPIQIGTTNDWSMILCGNGHTIALKKDGRLWSWGNNSQGQLGDGTNTDKNVPTVVACSGGLLLNTDLSNISCSGSADGSASISVSGGTTPYSYLWSNGATTEKITGLSAGTYSCTVTDASSLSITNSFVITKPSPLTAIITSTNACNNNNGSITATATGGTPQYQYAVSPALVYQTSNIFTSLSAGTYELYVKDNNGCIVSNIVTITATNTPPPTATAQTFNTGATVTNLQATGSNVKWYNDITGGNPLSSLTVIQTGKYYVSQTINGCESLRTAVDITVTSLIPTYIPSNGLIAYYPFTGNANDASGNGYNGTVTGAVLITDKEGNPNSAYSFDGVNSYIDAVIATIPQNNAPRTISGWFKTNSPNFAENNYSTIFNYGNLSTTQRFALSIYSKGYLDFITASDFSNNDLGVQNNYLNNTWYFFTITYDGTKVSLFVDGNYIDGKNITLNTINKTFRIGKRITGDTYNECFKGSIDDIGIWNRVLTPDEITLLYNANNLYTAIPDSNFEQKLIDLGIDSGNTDGKIPTSKINTVTDLNVSNSSITDLTGIQDFAQLTDLYCNQNQLTALNISKNKFLKTLDCNNNKIETLDVSNNVSLDSLSCYTNRLKSLNVKTNKALKKLDCGSNQISILDISENTALTFLGCNTSLLTTLDVSRNTALNLLDCRENKLTSLDVSQITTLTELYCQSNQLTNLDISNNKALEFLNCSKNQLTALDVSINTALVGLYSNSNQLKNLNLKNGNNDKFGYLNLTNNPNLSCIQVDDIDYFNTNWSSEKDAMANFNTDCPDSNPYTLIPDQNFEQKLIDLGIDTDGLNGKITIADISAITTLDLSNSNIKDLTGIENFTALNILDCRNNQLITLDLSKNTNLQILYVTGNPLVYLNLRNGNNQNLIVASVTTKKASSTPGTSFLGLTALGCVKVDNADYSNANWSKIKETTTLYSETCTLGLEDSELNKAIVYPNPTKGEVNILNIVVEKATVYNALGQLVKTFTLDSANTNNTINLSGLPKGVYYIYLITQDAASAKKVIVE
jgi:alpha-tubulin suppressor-like RCC1 family protein/Leucine-rich repeat (LRR) protein